MHIATVKANQLQANHRRITRYPARKASRAACTAVIRVSYAASTSTVRFFRKFHGLLLLGECKVTLHFHVCNCPIRLALAGGRIVMCETGIAQGVDRNYDLLRQVGFGRGFWFGRNDGLQVRVRRVRG